MMSKSVLFVTVVCGCVLQPSGFTQQFRAGRLITLSPNTTSSTFGQVYGIADFNGDGRPDLLVGANNGFGVNVADVLLQNSNGTFMEKTTSVPLGNTVVADVNGDGKADIVTAISAPIDVNHGDPLGPATLVIAYGIGSGAFRMEAPVNLQGGLFVSSLLVEDLNHDGRPDIMVSISDHNEAVIETFLNNGNSTFSPGPVYGTLTGGNLLASGDFNGDGFGDVVVNNNFETQILLGNGHGNFTAGATYNVNAYAAGVGDFNRDHHLDLALVGVKNSVVMLGKGNGTFTTSATLDTAYGTAISNVEFNNPVTPTQIYVGDLNKDGIPDLVVGALSATGVISIYYGKGNGTFNNPKAFNVGGSFASSEHPFAFGDMNRDGHLDVITQTNGHYAIAFGTNDGGLNAPIITQARMAGSIAKGDFNDDGIEDVAVVDEPICSSCTGTTVRVFLGTAHGFMTPPKTYSIPVKWGAIAAGDVNRDGKTDLVVTRNAYMINTNSGGIRRRMWRFFWAGAMAHSTRPQATRLWARRP